MGGWSFAFFLVWGVVLIVGGWAFRRHLPDLALHTLSLLFLLPAWAPPPISSRQVPALFVDISRSMDTPSKQAFVDEALKTFRNRYPRAAIYAFAEQTVPYDRRNHLRRSPTRPPRVEGPALLLTDGWWEGGWARFPDPVWPWIPEKAPTDRITMELPLTALPGPINVHLVTPEPGTLQVGSRKRAIPAGTTTVRLHLSPGFHRIRFSTSSDTVRRGVLVRMRETRVGIYARRPHPDAGALRRVLREIGMEPVVVLRDRLLFEDRVEKGPPSGVWGWFVLDPLPSPLPGMWTVQMDRALAGARWAPHPVFSGVLRASLPGPAPDSLGLVPQGDASYAWTLGNVFRMALRKPESLRIRLQGILNAMRARHPRLQIYALTGEVIPPDTARFWVEVMPPSTPVRFSLPARALEPGLFEVTVPVLDTGWVDTLLILHVGRDTLIRKLRIRGVAREEMPTETYDVALLEAIARASGGEVIRGTALPDLPLPVRSTPWPRWPFLLLAGLALLARWGVQYRTGRT